MHDQMNQLFRLSDQLLDMAEANKGKTLPPEWSGAVALWKILARKRSIISEDMNRLEKLVKDAEKACA